MFNSIAARRMVLSDCLKILLSDCYTILQWLTTIFVFFEEIMCFGRLKIWCDFQGFWKYFCGGFLKIFHLFYKTSMFPTIIDYRRISFVFAHFSLFLIRPKNKVNTLWFVVWNLKNATKRCFLYCKKLYNVCRYVWADCWLEISFY